MKGRLAFALLALASSSFAAVVHAPQDPPLGNPVAVIDLATEAGIAAVKGQWRTLTPTIEQIDFRGPGADLKASGAPNRTHDLAPKAGAANFNDAPWEKIPASSLGQRRSTGRLAYQWYRLNVTIPAKVGNLSTAGMVAAFEIVIDDYAEIWVDGQLPLVLGATGGPLIKGFNAPNRVLLSRQARPGQQFQLAIFGANGPLSNPPNNFIWIRSATLDFYRPSEPVYAGEIIRKEAALDAILARDARVEKIAEGFQFTEGPVWVRDGGYLLFSDPNANTIYRYDPSGQITVFRPKSGYAGLDIGAYHQPGSNGLTLDEEGRLTIDQHGYRRVVRQERNGQIVVLADRYNGKRLNSPNDVVYKSDGSLYFTDPPFGLPKVFNDPAKELPYSGVYRVKEGQVALLTTDLTGPNGIAFSPDEKYLYVSNWDPAKKWLMRYPVNADGTLGKGEVFVDMTSIPGEDALDGIKVDQKGNLYVAAPGGLGGIWVISPSGKHLGTIQPPEHAANVAWGDDDAQTLYITASTGLYRVRTQIPGIRP